MDMSTEKRERLHGLVSSGRANGHGGGVEQVDVNGREDGAAPVEHLSPKHYAELQASGLTDATIRARGYRTAYTDAEVEACAHAAMCKFTKNQVRAGLVLPAYLPGKDRMPRPDRVMVKPDVPEMGKGGKPKKYESPFTGGRRKRGEEKEGQVWDVGPARLPESASMIAFTEGIKKGDALRQVFTDAVVIALQSPTGFHNPDSGFMRMDIRLLLDEYARTPIYLCFDSDVATNPDIWRDVGRIRHMLREEAKKGKEWPVKVVLLRAGEGEKVGVDDLYASKGEGAVKAAFAMAEYSGENMPPSPIKDGRRKPKSAEEESAFDLAEEYKAYLVRQEDMLTDMGCEQAWLDGVAGHDGNLIEATARREEIYFDERTKYPYVLEHGDRVYKRVRADVPAAHIGRWLKGMADENVILDRPQRAAFPEGKQGEKYYRVAIKARQGAASRLLGVTKSRAVASLIAAHPDLNTEEFCQPEYDHLFPLTGGFSIDFSQAPGSDPTMPHGCPLVPTPTDARFIWRSPVTETAYVAATRTEAGGSEALDEFLGAISMDDRQTIVALLGFMGYVLHGKRKHRFFFLHGAGRNGKGVLLRLLAYLLGDGVLATNAKAFVGRDRRHDAHWLEHRYRRLVLCADPAGYTNDSMLLSYSGGDDVQGEVKGGEAVFFKATGAMVMHGQADRVLFKIADDALTDRMLALKLLRRFTGEEQNASVEDGLKADAAAILARLSHEAHDYHVAVNTGMDGPEQDFNGEATWRAGCRDLLNEANSVAQFMSEQGVYDIITGSTQSEVTVPNFIAHYERWCRENGQTAIKHEGGRLTKALQAAYPGMSTALRSLGGGRFNTILGLAFKAGEGGATEAERDTSGRIEEVGQARFA